MEKRPPRLYEPLRVGPPILTPTQRCLPLVEHLYYVQVGRAYATINQLKAVVVKGSLKVATMGDSLRSQKY